MVNKNKKTLVVNLYGGPGTGKSTNAAGLFHRLKTMGIDCEMVREYAKDLVWEERTVEFGNQISILGKQIKRIESLIGKVDTIITDSPVLLSGYYNNFYNKDAFDKIMLETQKRYNSLDIFLVRKKKYNPNGRNQTKEQAEEIDGGVRNYLDKLNIPYEVVDADDKCIDRLVELVKAKQPKLF